MNSINQGIVENLTMMVWLSICAFARFVPPDSNCLRFRFQNSSRSLIFAASFGGARIGFNSSRGLVATVFVFTVNAQVPFGRSFPF
jgi:hypothetical protein